MNQAALRIGVLGAAKIAPMAIISPAKRSAEVTVSAIAARDPERGREFAHKHGIARVMPSYEAMITDPAIDAVYIPLPAALHGRWTLAAIEAGKHVLCEKPFAANAAEAEQVAAAAKDTSLVVMDGFHYRYHALTERVLELLSSGTIGEVQQLRSRFDAPILSTKNIRYDFALGGGALMDLGCYCVHLLRTLAGNEPRVIAAQARRWRDTDVDVSMRAHLEFPGGAAGTIACNMRRFTGMAGAKITGTRGTVQMHNFIHPHFGNWITVRTSAGRSRMTVPRRPRTFDGQLAAFAGAVLRDESVPTSVDDAVATMRVIDSCYRAAGLPVRVPVDG